ncbi:MAG: hypothetical protein AAGU21_01890 [Solidesulfovibrio sp.]|uniref:hypothetical protein n=1 Tax=Solidesulfovibrio sp. TaxID=2910990 RepID=UPI002B20CBED|nr:hypothetical protein [Solidesulfovibrio sp.]MEA4857784.1 hypothetical protein [Solidesulfovibrio sp.]
MRLHKSVLYVLFPAFLCYCAAIAHATTQKDVLSGPTSALTELGRLLPRLAGPACLAETATQAMGGLRRAVADSWLMRDSRPSQAQARRDFVALWAELEGAPAWARHESAAGTPGSTELLPGQD